MHVTPGDSVPDLLRRSDAYFPTARELQQPQIFISSVNMHEVNYQRHVDGTDQHHAGEGPQTQRCHREIHFPFLAERYERLEDEEERVKLKEERKRRKKKQYKKVRKNVGKALRVTWKCLVLGLYNFALGYSTPITVAATFTPDFHPGPSTS